VFIGVPGGIIRIEMRPLMRRVHGLSRAWTAIPRPARLAGGAVAAVLVLVIAAAVTALVPGRSSAATGSPTRAQQPARQDVPGSFSLPTTGPDPVAGGASGTAPSAVTDYTGIVLPDLLIVMPTGLTTADIAGLRAIKGVRKMITFDGAQVSANGSSASVIGVNPAQLRSWVPLRTAADQKLWTQLAAGDFVASSSVARVLQLTPGTSYTLSGAAELHLTYAAAADLGIQGVDLVVNQTVSRELGLVHEVAALVSAPGPSIGALTAQVRIVLGAGAKIVDLRGSGLPVSASSPAHITDYLQLFQAAAAKYCPAMSWTVLAAIGQIESADGQNMGPSTAGALGPMQFLPSTWAEWGIDGFGPAGKPDIWNPMAAVPSAARMLCADGASAGTTAGLRQAIFAYNHADWYVNEVLALAAKYATEHR
jgi:hypothetical protein